MKLRVTIRNQDQLDAFVGRFNKMPIPATGWSVEADEFKNSRSLAQNRMLFGRVYPPICLQMAEATGALLTKDQLHKFFKDQFSPREITTVMGKTICTPKSTTKFTRAEFSDFIEKIYAWSSDNGIWHE